MREFLCGVTVPTCCRAEAETGGCWGCCCARLLSGQEGVAGLVGAALAAGSFCPGTPADPAPSDLQALTTPALRSIMLYSYEQQSSLTVC